MVLNPNFSENARHDYALVQDALNGDQKAFAELLGRYRDSIYFMLLKMCNNKSDADDLTIEAFGKAFRNLNSYSSNFAFSTWLFKIATNNCIDYLRKQRGSNISIDQPIDMEDFESSIEIQSPTLDPEEQLIKSQREKLLHTVVAKLKPRYKRLIELRYFQEKSYEEMADELEIPIGTVKAQLFRARDLLFQIIKRSNCNF